MFSLSTFCSLVGVFVLGWCLCTSCKKSVVVVVVVVS